MKRVLLAAAILFPGASALPAEALEMPFEIDSAQSAILVRASADGKPVLLVLDTGASRTILARELVRSAPQRLAPSGFSGDGPGLRVRGRYTEATLALGGRTWKNRSVVVMDMAEVSLAFGRRIDGLLGQDLLREFERVTIDFRARILRLE
jgi:hypothetical protein